MAARGGRHGKDCNRGKQAQLPPDRQFAEQNKALATRFVLVDIAKP
jgi:hypothetical protein